MPRKAGNATVPMVAAVATDEPEIEAKIVEVDAFDVDVPVSEHMAFFRYHDRPGVVGTVGRILGEANVNIGATMSF